MENQNQPSVQPATSTEVREVTEQDREWIAKLYRHNKSQLGSFSGAWRRFISKKDPGLGWACIEGVGFAKYVKSSNGEIILQKLAVSEQCKRNGLGRKFLSRLGPVVQVTVDVNNAEGNAFCKGTGFVVSEQKKSLYGKRVLNVWKKLSNENLAETAQ